MKSGSRTTKEKDMKVRTRSEKIRSDNSVTTDQKYSEECLKRKNKEKAEDDTVIRIDDDYLNLVTEEYSSK